MKKILRISILAFIITLFSIITSIKGTSSNKEVKHSTVAKLATITSSSTSASTSTNINTNTNTSESTSANTSTNTSANTNNNTVISNEEINTESTNTVDNSIKDGTIPLTGIKNKMLVLINVLSIAIIISNIVIRKIL